MSRVIHVLVEGLDDERFVKEAIETELVKKHSRVKVYKYAQVARPSLEKFIKSLDKSGTEYIFLSDMDRVACYTKKKEQIRSKTAKNADHKKTAIVKAEIESWYLAGLNRHDAGSLGIQHLADTEGVTKEDFGKMSERYTSRTDCMMAILKNFSLETAKKQNGSFMYFCSKFL